MNRREAEEKGLHVNFDEIDLQKKVRHAKDTVLNIQQWSLRAAEKLAESTPDEADTAEKLKAYINKKADQLFDVERNIRIHMGTEYSVMQVIATFMSFEDYIVDVLMHGDIDAGALAYVVLENSKTMRVVLERTLAVHLTQQYIDSLEEPSDE